MVAEPAQRQNTPVARDANGHFKPGASGNPGGRPKGIASEARRLTGANGRKYLKMLDELARDASQKTSDRIECAKLVLERGWGKAAAFAPVEGSDPLELSDVDRAIEQTLDELAARREAQVPRADEARAVADPGQG